MLIGVPDHWHALIMIEAVKSGVDVYVQKPISVDVMEGAAMLAAARASTSAWCRWARSGAARRTWLRRKTRFLDEGKLGKIGLVEIYCYYHMRADDESARHRAARLIRLRDVDRTRTHAPLSIVDASAHLARFHGIRQRHRR